MENNIEFAKWFIEMIALENIQIYDKPLYYLKGEGFKTKEEIYDIYMEMMNNLQY